MNMPVDDEGKVNFTSTLFALIRENLNIKMRSGRKIGVINQLNLTKKKFQLMKWTKQTTN